MFYPKQPIGNRVFIILHDPDSEHFQGAFPEGEYNPAVDFLNYRNEGKWQEWKSEQEKKDRAKRVAALKKQKAEQEKKDQEKRKNAPVNPKTSSSEPKVSENSLLFYKFIACMVC